MSGRALCEVAVKVVTYGNLRRVGVLADGFVVDANRAYAEFLKFRGEPHHEQLAAERVPSRLVDYISRGEAAITCSEEGVAFALAAGEAHSEEVSRSVLPVAQAGLQAPWAGRRIACAGGNFAAHSSRMSQIANSGSTGQQGRAEGQWGFWKVIEEVLGPGSVLPYPRRASHLDYEGEPVAVIGRRGKNIRADEAESYIWGVTLGNDWSIRSERRPNERQRRLSYNLDKNFDGCISIGDCIAVGEVDPQNIDVETRVNDDLRQKFNSKDMLFSFAEIIELLSTDFTLLPGDLICGGTGAGTVADRIRSGEDGRARPYLQVGDVVEVSSPNVGTLRNAIIASDTLADVSETRRLDSVQ
jgi:2-keto-4-pentenoate hydratase/2-oxohepta-3-ene-1,7-dioic acid hydratase in catechol pathway